MARRAREQADSSRPIKKTVAIHPLIDKFVKETWTVLIHGEGITEPSYSQALNFMLVGAILQAGKTNGWTQDTLRGAWDFARAHHVAEQLKAHEALPLFAKQIEEEERH